MEDWHETEIRVRYAETDQMGIVHHANYLIWFESGRSDLCRARGFSYKEMEDKDDALMVVAEATVRYKSPAFYEDVLSSARGSARSEAVRSDLFTRSSARQTIRLLAEGETLHLVTDQNKKVRQIPEVYRTILLSEPQPQEQAFPANQAPH